MEKVSKKAINYWRLQAVFKTVISLTVIIVGLVLIYFFPFIKIPAFVVIGIAVVFFLYEVIYNMLFYPRLFYKYFEFQVTDDLLIVNSGIFNKKHIVIPLFRIQNVDVTEGPIMKHIPELEKKRADELRSKIREIVRVKRNRVNEDD